MGFYRSVKQITFINNENVKVKTCQTETESKEFYENLTIGERNLYQMELVVYDYSTLNDSIDEKTFTFGWKVYESRLCCLGGWRSIHPCWKFKESSRGLLITIEADEKHRHDFFEAFQKRYGVGYFPKDRLTWKDGEEIVRMVHQGEHILMDKRILIVPGSEIQEDLILCYDRVENKWVRNGIPFKWRPFKYIYNTIEEIIEDLDKYDRGDCTSE